MTCRKRDLECAKELAVQYMTDHRLPGTKVLEAYGTTTSSPSAGTAGARTTSRTSSCRTRGRKSGSTPPPRSGSTGSAGGHGLTISNGSRPTSEAVSKSPQPGLTTLILLAARGVTHHLGRRRAPRCRKHGGLFGCHTAREGRRRPGSGAAAMNVGIIGPELDNCSVLLNLAVRRWALGSRLRLPSRGPGSCECLQTPQTRATSSRTKVPTDSGAGRLSEPRRMMTVTLPSLLGVMPSTKPSLRTLYSVTPTVPDPAAPAAPAVVLESEPSLYPSSAALRADTLAFVLESEPHFGPMMPRNSDTVNPSHIEYVLASLGSLRTTRVQCTRHSPRRPPRV